MKAITGEVRTESGALTAREQQQLKAAEADVERGGKLIVAAMELIRDQRLYRATHASFDDYCQERWNKTASAVNKAILREAVVQRITEQIGEHVPQQLPILTHRAAAELADLPPEEAAEVVMQATKNGGKPTARRVKAARQESEAQGDASTAVSRYFDGKGDGRKVTGGTAFNVDELGDKPKTEKSSIVKDALDRDVPGHLTSAASAAAAISSCASKIDAIRREAEQLATAEGGDFIEVSEVNRLARELKTAIGHARFYTTCPRCDGAKCDRCGRSGWIPHSRKGQLSDDDKAKLGVQK